jgi:hypothetical protein
MCWKACIKIDPINKMQDSDKDRLHYMPESTNTEFINLSQGMERERETDLAKKTAGQEHK